MADYSSPKPVDPIWYKPDGWLVIKCRCGRELQERVRHFADRNGVSRNLKFYELIDRLRCSACGGRPEAEVRATKRP